LTIIFRGGYHDYLMGVDPVWQSFRSVYQMSRRPFIIGGCFLLTGFLWAMMMHPERPVSKELVEFRKREQMRRLREFFGTLFLPKRF
jgi:poly-beta-1,6-N-acetyl-D-glucosamine synthase